MMSAQRKLIACAVSMTLAAALSTPALALEKSVERIRSDVREQSLVNGVEKRVRLDQLEKVAQLARPERVERRERAERPEKAERGERAERPEKAERPERD
ncbi:MAG: hypothetical protein O9274_12290 [Limnobacter sp.]|uniref:hypothetical protein n=1 Tax=Limnobacter sp. TaxID=2003368 RepID=UPI0022BECBE5|nr:hypothetical protein [Limnobacter sp.]MCZ8016473.1 hypothetical protein [Limnobacter sp.]